MNPFFYSRINSGLILLYLLLSTPLFAQDGCISEDSSVIQACCNGLIITDPSAAWNPARPDLRNRFDWRDPKWEVYLPTPGGGYTTGGNQPLLMDNPFFTRNAQLSPINFAKYPSNFSNTDSLDFHPADGWELLHKYDGFDSLGTNYLYGGPDPYRPGPYVMLYNRYTGRLRVLASFEGINPQTDLMETSIRQRALDNLGQIKSSTLLMKHHNIAQPLSEKTKVGQVSSVSEATSTSEFFATEFDLAYDPCICLNYSEIEFEFGIIDTALVNLSGTLIGTSQVINTNGNSPLLNNQDFLTSVYKNGLNVEAGTLTYQNIDNLVDKYKAGPGLTPFEEVALGLVGSVIKTGIGSADTWLTKGIDALATEGIKDLGLVNDSSGAPNSKFKAKTGLKLLGSQSDRILTAMGLKSSPNRTPGVSVIESEMAMSGIISNSSNLGGNSSILLRVPGSLGTDLPGNSPWFYYPTYNEPLGLMAVLDSPVVSRVIGQSRPLYPYENEEEVAVGTSVLNTWIGPYASYQFEDISFVFNPAAEVDEEKTVILGALVVKGPCATLNQEEFDYYQNSLDTITYPGYPGPVQYISPFLSLECLKDYTVGDFEP